MSLLQPALAVLFLALPASTNANAQAALALQWQEFASVDGHYTVSFPGRPRSHQAETGDWTTMKTNLYFQEVAFGEEYYAVTWNALRGTSVLQKDILEKSAAGAVKNVPGGARIAERSVQASGITGLEILIDAPKHKMRVRQRFYVIGTRLIQQLHVGPPGSETTEDVERFMASLALKP
jgi:hypothetical protein